MARSFPEREAEGPKKCVSGFESIEYLYNDW
jgi:hypothetical protein